MITPLEQRRFLSASLVGGALTVTGTSGNDTITVSRNGIQFVIAESGAGTSTFNTSSVATFTINAGDGNDLIDIKTSINRSIIINAGLGNDTIKGGGSGGDLFFGDAGTDTLDYSYLTEGVTVTFDQIANDGRSGEQDNVDESIDIIIGTRGDDDIDASDAPVIGKTLFGGYGNDILSGSDFADRLDGGPGDDDLSGGAGNDTMTGIDGADSYTGGTGTDTLDFSAVNRPLNLSFDGLDNDGYRGTAGDASHGFLRANIGTGSRIVTPVQGGPVVPVDDSGIEILIAGRSNDVITGGPNNDIIFGGPGRDSIVGQSGDDYIRGGAGNDTISGQNGNDKVYGELGDDLLYGQGRNTFGNNGADTLTGGAGRDRFVEYEFFGGGGNTTIIDFVGADDTLIQSSNNIFF